MPCRPIRPRKPRNRTAPSLRLHCRMLRALDELREWQDTLIERTGLSALESATLHETLDLCRRAVARETPPHWLRLLPRNRPPGITELSAIVDDAVDRLTLAKAASEQRARAAGLLD